ncbi:DUF805 domain-containing protein [Caulobacter sp. 17J65-9]|uniref:DUF805 domain-containing protein n=1 Tax=Caulobacter sp. 17J65-9 TaxID=2709382 RepID=UPI0013CCC989|nr:DUF805 domain-containing protein [Caulobacter sp. 17J65-9]NEX92958.1 DUF805 domain-containing protein [Caulobacter sp. 17J65-9]
MLSFLFGFNGRLRRSHYFLGALAVCVISNLFGLAAINGDADVVEGLHSWSMVFTPNPVVVALASVIGILAFWANMALAARRWHDVGASGWLALLALIPGASFALFFLLCIIPGTKGPNRHGPDPKADSGAPVTA